MPHLENLQASPTTHTWRERGEREKERERKRERERREREKREKRKDQISCPRSNSFLENFGLINEKTKKRGMGRKRKRDRLPARFRELS
jgi:hypothetical protein